ncbi:MAG: hypothetical protein COA57_11225 [Flavobacteriales bacterium]|nr:MAG: hypothetical protein COA57_11225 [Flavobacteriales bacterium]
MEGHAKEWMNLIVRWAHVIAGISWIGASFYFIFLENALNRTKGLSDELAGNLWAIHGGGFYYLEKFKGAPEKLPKELHWFKYEAYFTWLSGFALMWIVYYADAKAFLVDPMILDISSELGIAIGIGSMVFSWLIYDALCKTKLVEKRALFGLVGFGLFVLIEWALCEVMNPRAAYIHAGALLGTCMVANVFFVIIPSQKALVKAAKLNQPLDPKLGKNAGLRSLHNNYITLPVLFIMISNHFPSTFGHEHNWLILAGLALASAGIKHYWNLYEAGKSDYFMLGISIAALVVIFLLTAPVSREEKLKDAPEVSFIQVNDIIQRRCISCHSASPTDDTWTAAPNGVMYDTPQQIVKMQDKILQRAVLTKNMPQGNKTGMTQEERDVLEIWIYQGAKTDF